MGRIKDIREAVESELEYDPLVDSAYIVVKNMTGDVALNGTVPSYPQYMEAAEAARRLADVTSGTTTWRCCRRRENYRDDAMLTTAANDTLAANIMVPAVSRRPPGTATSG